MYSIFNTNFSTSNNQNKDHFDSGKYELIKIILHWSIAELKSENNLNATELTPIQTCNATSEQYYAQYKPLIVEEAKTIVKEGFGKINFGKISKTTVKINVFKASKNPNNPSLLIMDGRLPNDLETTQAIVVLLKSSDGEEILGITSGHEQNNQFTNQLKIKLVLDNNQRSNIIFIKGASWEVYPLGSVISQIRAYEVCSQKPNVPFMQDCITGNPSDQNSLIPLQESLFQSNELLTKLNPSQQEAILKFLQLRQGLHLLQGPPGTGKTTTIITLLKALCIENKRILVCAPSNKAVQVLAKRFLETFSDRPIALAGIEKKVPLELQPIFIHTWAKQIYNHIEKIEKDISDLKHQGDKIDLIKASELIKKINLAYHALMNRINTSIPNLITNEQLTFNQQIYSYTELLKTLPNNESSESQIPIVLERLLNILHNVKKEISQDKHKNNYLEIQLLNHAKVIFTTLSVAGRDTLKEMNPVDVLIVDEAAQAIEAETLIPFQHNPQKCLLVGDTKQLPALVKSSKAVECHLDWSMMWRLMEENKYPFQMLTVQYRMQPEIRHWPSQKYYDNQLEDSHTILNRNLPQLSSIFHPYSFIDIKTNESFQGVSYSNEKEADYIVKILKYLKKQHSIKLEKQVGIITFYSGQVELIQTKLKSNKLENILVNSVDGYQGDECDFIIISFVRANAKNKIGFLNDFRRLNVAITRAKLSLIMLGNQATLSAATSDIEHLLTDTKERGYLYDEEQLLKIINPKNCNKISPNQQQKALPTSNRHTKFFSKDKFKANIVQQKTIQNPPKNSTNQPLKLEVTPISSEQTQNPNKSNTKFFEKKLKPSINKYEQAKQYSEDGKKEESAGQKCNDSEQKLKHYTTAIEHYSKAIEIQPSFYQALRSCGTLKLELGILTKKIEYFQDAILDLNAAISSKNEFAKTYINYARSKVELGNYTDDKNHYHSAIEDLTKAIELEPNNDKAYHLRASTKEKVGLDGKKDKEMAKKLKSQKYKPKTHVTKKEEVKSSPASSSMQ